MIIETKGRKVLGAHRWWKNGDCPGDEAEVIGIRDGAGNVVRTDLADGKIVGRYSPPAGTPPYVIDGACGQPWGGHGVVNASGDVVCPGDWIVTRATGHDVEKEDPMLSPTVSEDDETTLVVREADGTEQFQDVEFIADCYICEGREEFTSAEERDEYAFTHQEETRHAVSTYMQPTAEPRPVPPREEPTAEAPRDPEPTPEPTAEAPRDPEPTVDQENGGSDV